MLEYEKKYGGVVLGLDEAGRGPLVGGVFAAAVHLPIERAEILAKTTWVQVNDSKKLSPRKREELAEIIKNDESCVWAVASASSEEIDQLNILNATHLAFRRAAQSVLDKLGEKAQKAVILVDGLPVKNLPVFSENIIKGDSKSLLIAAASILAETARDKDCERLDRLYPGYGFLKHKGYPVKAHYEALSKLGACPEHRKSFSPVKAVL
jgi:ribonuclease HII